MRKKLFIPGPTEVREEVRLAQSQPMIGHRMAEFSVLYERIIERLKRLLNTHQNVMVFTSSATGVMEGAIRNTVRENLLSFTMGAFSERWAKIAKSCGKKVDVVELEWGKAVKPEMLSEHLSKKRYDAVLITHNETSTGVMNPLKELAGVVKDFPDTLLLVDAVSSLTGVPIDIDGWGIDVIFASVQKCFALPPGLTVAVVSDRAMERSKEVPDRGYYFDFLTTKRYFDERRQTPATPAISLLYAMDIQLDRMEKEGMENRYRRHLEMARIVQNWAERYFGLFAEEGYRSPTVTAIKNTRGIKVSELIDELGKRGYVISNGYGKLKEITFRIGHMGDITPKEIDELLREIEDILGLEI